MSFYSNGHRKIFCEFLKKFKNRFEKVRYWYGTSVRICEKMKKYGISRQITTITKVVKTLKIKKLIALILLLSTLLTINMPFAFAESETVESVTAQLKAIDSLQTMQNNRSKYKPDYYRFNYIKQDWLQYKDSHIAAQNGYNKYVANMTAARTAAKQAYDSLTPEQQAQIDPTLVAKLDDTLETVMMEKTFTVTPRDDEYRFEVVGGKAINPTKSYPGLGYEVSHHRVADVSPQTFVIVDTSDGKTTWTSGEKYEYGISDFEVAYCCDYDTELQWGTDYRRINLEDSPFFTDYDAQKIRTIVMNSYPYVSIDEMKQKLKDNGLSASYVDSLTRSDIISAVQMSIWHYTRKVDPQLAGYTGSTSVTLNSGISWFTSIHDSTNETWEWFPVKGGQTFLEGAKYRINNLIYYLCNLEGTEATKKQTVISNIQIGRVDLVPRSTDLYNLGLHITLNNGCDDSDDVSLKITSYSEDDEGSRTVTNTRTIKIEEENEYTLSVNAKYGDTIEVEAIGTQNIEKGVYFYESNMGTEVSQSLVDMAEGETPVHAVKSFSFERDIDGGLRIYKKSTEDQTPISDITFDVYEVKTNEGEELSDTPTPEEIAKYAVDENLVGSVITDETGYASLELGYGTYLVVEQHNEEKVLAPADPFYITLPWPTEVEVDGEKVIEYLDVVSVYPKNTPVTPPPPPPPPPPEDIYGKFTIVKHDNNDNTDLLEGAKFKIYRAATETDSDIENIICDGLTCAVTPVIVDGEQLVLTTDSEGKVTSPELDIGVYYIKEVKAPLGYVLPKESKSVTVTSMEISETTYVYIGNDRGIKLPETGGTGTYALTFVGFVLCIGAVSFIITKKHKKES